MLFRLENRLTFGSRDFLIAHFDTKKGLLFFLIIIFRDKEIAGPKGHIILLKSIICINTGFETNSHPRNLFRLVGRDLGLLVYSMFKKSLVCENKPGILIL